MEDTAVLVATSPPSDCDLSIIGSRIELSPSDRTQSLTQDLRAKIIKQVEYYFSDENLPTDNHLIGFVKKDREGFVPIGVIASFRKMKKLVQDNSLIVSALRESSLLVVSSNGKKVKRLHPIPLSEVMDPKLCTVLVENLPEDHSSKNIRKIFGEIGNIKKVFVCDPHTIDDSRNGSKVEKLISTKVHALVEYDTIEAAEKAVATLNDQQDWRTGMRVKVLMKIGRGGSRGKKFHGQNGHGHGTTSSSYGIEACKPHPGPRMPDGTKGFTVGRGRPT